MIEKIVIATLCSLSIGPMGEITHLLFRLCLLSRLATPEGVLDSTLSFQLHAWDCTIRGVSPTYIPWVYISESCRANC